MDAFGTYDQVKDALETRLQVYRKELQNVDD